MYHSLTFGVDHVYGRGNDKNKNTYDDWKLVPTSRPLFEPPRPKTVTVDIPGGDGVIDLSNALTPYPVYDNRTGSLEFAVLNGYREWQLRYTEIMDFLHGRRLKVYLEDDPEYYYEGYFSVNKWNSKSDGKWSTIVIDYNVSPYKLAVQSTTEDWIWDLFNFEEGQILPSEYRGIIIDSDDWIELDMSEYVERKPTTPKITATGNITVALYNEEMNIKWLEKSFPNGTTEQTIYDFVITNLFGSNTIKMRYKGHGTLTIDFRNGRL